MKAVPLALGDVHRNHDQAAKNAEENHDVPTHLGEAQKEHGIQPHGLDQLRFPSLDDRLDPGKEALAHWGRRVSLVCMLDLGRIDKRVAGSEEGKEKREKDCDADRGT